MTTQRRQSDDFLWPVPPSELEDIEVIEGLFTKGGRAAAPDTALPDTPHADHPAPTAVCHHPAAVWRLAEAAARPQPLPTATLRTWWGAAERVGWLAAGVVVGVGMSLVRSPDAVPGPLPAALAVASSGAREADRTAQPPLMVLGVQLPAQPAPARTGVGPGVAPAATASAGASPSLPLPAPAAATAGSVNRAVARGSPLPPTRRALSRAASEVARERPPVMGPIQDYATAWSRLDARGTQAVFPSVDRDQLVQRFTAISEQRLTLGGCVAAVTGSEAHVTCQGTLRYRPRVGGLATRVQHSRWRFALSNASGTWVITSVDPS